MKAHTNLDAAPVPGEDELFKRLERIDGKRKADKPVSHIAIAVPNGIVRHVLITESNFEDERAMDTLDEMGFIDVLQEGPIEGVPQDWITATKRTPKGLTFDSLFVPPPR